MLSSAISSRAILCVDSDPAISHALAAILPSCQTVSAVNGYEALKAFNERTFDLYVLDFWLPDWSGVQLCREIRKVDPRGPVFFCARAARDEDRKRAIRAGASIFLPKPLDAAQLTRQTRIAFELSDLESLRAKVEEERAVQDELTRLTALAKTRALNARETALHAMERTARTKAYKAFVEAGGTRANFDRWWPQVSGSVAANSPPPPRSMSRGAFR